MSVSKWTPIWGPGVRTSTVFIGDRHSTQNTKWAHSGWQDKHIRKAWILSVSWYYAHVLCSLSSDILQGSLCDLGLGWMHWDTVLQGTTSIFLSLSLFIGQIGEKSQCRGKTRPFGFQAALTIKESGGVPPHPGRRCIPFLWRGAASGSNQLIAGQFTGNPK